MGLFEDVVNKVLVKNKVDTVGGIVDAGDAILRNLKGGGGSTAPAPLSNPGITGGNATMPAPSSIPEIGISFVKQWGVYIGGGLAGLAVLWMLLGRRKGGRK